MGSLMRNFTITVERGENVVSIELVLAKFVEFMIGWV